MTHANAEVLHKHFLEVGNVVAAKQLEVRFPILAKSETVKEKKEREAKEVKDGQV